jgi:hypothetical protein
MPAGPCQTASWFRGKKGWFNEREEKIIVNRVIREDPGKSSMHNREPVTPRLLWQSLKDYDLWLVPPAEKRVKNNLLITENETGLFTYLDLFSKFLPHRPQIILLLRSRDWVSTLSKPTYLPSHRQYYTVRSTCASETIYPLTWSRLSFHNAGSHIFR